MSSCQVITGPSQLTTDFATSTIPSQQLITAPPTTSTTSSPVVTSTCSQPIAIANVSLPLTQCSTYTSYVTGQTVIPGTVATSTSFLTSVYSNVRTLPGVVSTTCTVLPTTAAPTTTPTIAPSTAQRTTTTTTTTTTRSRSTTMVIVPTTTTPTTTAVTTSAVVVSTPVVITTDGEELTITSFSTLFVTMTGSDGQVSVLTSSSGVPTLNSATEGTGGLKKVHTGAIAGGVVGGIIALLLAIFILVALRRKGCFRSSDEHFDDDIWSPDAHGQGVVGIKARSVNHDDDDDADVGMHSGEIMSEKEAEEAAMEGSRHSWHARASSFSSEPVQPTIWRISSPTAGHSNYNRANELTRSASAAAAARVRRSVSGVSSSGHESHESYRSAPPTHLQSPTSAAYYQSRRMSQHEFYQQQEQQARARSPTSPTCEYEYTIGPNGGYERPMEHRVAHRRIAPNDGMSTMSRHDSVVSRHQSYSNHATSPTEVSRRQSFSSLPVSNTGAPTRRNSTVASRNNSFHSSSDHSSNLATTGSTSANSHGHTHGNLRPLTSLSPTSPTYYKPYEFKRPQLEVVVGADELPSDSLSSGVVPSLLSSNGSSEDASYDPRPPTPSSAILLDLPRPEFLQADRPKMERSSSTSSVIAPSQFLGARIVNVDEPIAVT
ncbi:BZ3500_MvSof-1268-A1-R1_Chr2-1g04259 [Microbotryum saponariae]|uniref:BZ3500_MvSof-1268-A1-R1_Chr2-1g04259 protein n=1 Tax=Microbotryum saponariae TaxID=289078 RepID=A0A2X0KA66_9BASI|nr:BZ3500_MvSof-1268-A1-R1_Chr2-1g04259 [Microbotryum saponariae]SCZ91249.1 BZ3501_MvSof-1269-A2-R1_Chr2-1g03915 [Microbotryum saponariae]